LSWRNNPRPLRNSHMRIHVGLIPRWKGGRGKTIYELGELLQVLPIFYFLFFYGAFTLSHVWSSVPPCAAMCRGHGKCDFLPERMGILTHLLFHKEAFDAN